MQKLFPLIAALGLAFSLAGAHAADAEKTPQQTKMAACNKDASGKKGDERKDFMKTCLSAKAEAPAAPAAAPADEGKTAQQSKMTTCNADAKTKELKGDERKAFMKSCLSAKADTPATPAADDGKTAQQSKMTACNKDATGKKGDERKKFMSECLKG